MNLDVFRSIAILLATATTLVASEPEAPLEDALVLLERLDAERLTLEERGIPLKDAMRTIASQTSIPIRADWDALGRLGVDSHDRVDLECDRTSALTALRGLAIQLGDEFERPTWESYAGAIHLTTHAATEGMGFTDVYDVRDLLAAGVTPDYGEAEEFDDEDDWSDDEDEAAGDDDDAPDEEKSPPAGANGLPGAPDIDDILANAPPSRAPTPGEALLWMIADHVDPEGWRSYGGSRGTISESGGVLLVTAPATTHRQFRRALGELRRAVITSVSIDVMIVDVPRAVLERLRRRHDLGSASLLQAIRRDQDSVTVWQALGAGSLDEMVEISVGKGGFDATLTVESHFDQDRGVLEMDIAAKVVEAGSRAEVKTTVVVPFRFGGVTLELPSAESQDQVRLLLIHPKRAG